MKTKILYDNELEVLDSGTFIHYDLEKPVTLSISEPDGTNINIRIEFLHDTDAKDELFKISKYNDDTLKIEIKHKGKLLNHGFINPVNVGGFNGHELFFNIRLDLNSVKDSPLVTYTWFQRKTNKL